MEISRRALARSAAWSVPVVAIAVAAPAASASGGGPVPNGSANYFWDAESQSNYTRLDPAAGGLQFNYSTQISYQADPYVGPPDGACLEVTISFTREVTQADLVSGDWTKVTPSGNGPSETFTYRKCPSKQGGSLSVNFVGSKPGSIESSSTMTLINGGDTTWTNVVSEAETTLVD